MSNFLAATFPNVWIRVRICIVVREGVRRQASIRATR